MNLLFSLLSQGLFDVTLQYNSTILYIVERERERRETRDERERENRNGERGSRSSIAFDNMAIFVNKKLVEIPFDATPTFSCFT